MKKRLLWLGSIGLLAASALVWMLLPGLTRMKALVDEGEGIYVVPRVANTVKEGPIMVDSEGLIVSTGASRRQFAAERAAARISRPQVVDFLGIPEPLYASPAIARDAALQFIQLPRVATTNAANFVGLGLGGLDDSTGENMWTPPDTNSATGTGTDPGQVVENVNLFWGVYNKSTGAVLAGPTELADFFPSTSPCSGATIGSVVWDLSDPVVKFDQLANRWVLTFLSFEDAPVVYGNSYLCMAVSETPDATGTFYSYAFDVGNIFSSGNCSATSGCLNDYQKFGVWPGAYFTSWNYFTQTRGSFTGTGVCAVASAAVQAGASATMVCFKTASSTESLLPSDLDGGAGVAGSTQLPPGTTRSSANCPAGVSSPFCLATTSPDYYIGALNRSTSFQLWKFSYNPTNPGASTFTGPATVTVSNYTEAGTSVPQLGTTNKLPTLGDRLLFRNAYRYFGNRNHGWESIVVSHSVNPGSGYTCPVAARWYELRNTGPVASGTFAQYQAGTFGPTDGYCRFMPSVAMDAKGDIALGYSESSASSYPSSAYTGRTPNDPLGAMESENVVAVGQSYEAAGDGSPYDRWGDYSSMELDPSDDCTFWNSQEFILQPGSGTGTHANEFNWVTNINSFNFSPNCHANPH